jgi:NAD(P)-dependent dehydrogenase (short-subunit alcohol dehydrogenase family)
MATFDDLAGKSGLVTGANGGMGLAIANALVRAGVSVMAADVQDAPGALLSPAVDYRRCDVSIPADVDSLVDAVITAQGRLDCAVNAAAIEFETVRLHELELADFDRMMNVNLRGMFLCLKAELRAMLPTGGSIVNIASTTSFKAGRRQTAYTTSKHGVVGLTRATAVDYARDAIRINAIAPGNIDTPMLRNAIVRRGGTFDGIATSMPFGRFGSTQEIADAALFLCSSASSFTTGHVLTVEGGMLVQ